MTDNTDPLFSSSQADPASNSPDPNDNPDHDYVQDLVGEGKKFKDHNALARSVLHKDMHIREIERENAELRQAVKQGLSREEFYEAIKTLQPSPSNQSQNDGEEERKDISLEQLGSLVDQRIQERSALAQQEQNLQYAVSEAQKRLGPNFQRLLKERAGELGESEQDLTMLARTRPKVFLELMAPQKAADPHIPSHPHTQVDSGKTGTGTNPNVRDMAFYRNLKKSDPKLYASREIQAQMHKDALALGEKFFN